MEVPLHCRGQFVLDEGTELCLPDFGSLIKFDVFGEALQSCICSLCSLRRVRLTRKPMALEGLQELTGIIFGDEVDEGISQASRGFTSHRHVEEIELICHF